MARFYCKVDGFPTITVDANSTEQAEEFGWGEINRISDLPPPRSKKMTLVVLAQEIEEIAEAIEEETTEDLEEIAYAIEEEVAEATPASDVIIEKE